MPKGCDFFGARCILFAYKAVTTSHSE